MQTFEVDEKQFDLKGFVDALRKFWRRMGGGMNPDSAFATLDPAGEDAPWPDPDEATDPLDRLRAGKGVFAMFHDRGHCEGDPIRCVDGAKIDVPEKEDDDGNPNPAWDERFENLPSESQSYGYIITLEGGKVRIQSSLTVDEQECFDPVDDCGVFDEPMAKFVQRFVR